MATARSRRSTAPTVVGALLVVVALLAVPAGGVSLSAGAAVGVPPTVSPAATPSSAVLSSAVVSGSFAVRSGYTPELVSRLADASPAQGTRLVVVTFQPRSPSLYVPPSPGTPPLTMAALSERFGLTAPEYSAAEEFFVAHGLSIVRTWPDRLSLNVEGPVGALNSAFGTTLLSGVYQGRPVTIPSTPPSLPSALESEVAGVVGLSTGVDRFAAAPVAPGPGTGSASPTGGNANLVTPAIARDIYDLSGLYNFTGSPRFATGEGIALLLWGPGYDPNDLTQFYQQDYPSNFPPVPIVPKPVDGAPNPSPSAASDPCGAAQELTLDLEWSGSMAPGATLYPVYAPGSPAPTCSPSASSMSDALHTAIGLPISALSMSFSANESSDSALRSTWDVYFAEAVQLGITLLAATGDLGGFGLPGCGGGPAPQYPSTSPDVLAVGGTDVTLSRNPLGQLQGFSETAWSQSGGGVSTQFAPPAWQQGLGYSGRAGPDVSATAAENFFFYSGRAMVAAGTSFATPLWAGLLAEMDAQYGRTLVSIAPRLYAIGAEVARGTVSPGLSDVTSGSTCLGPAGPGFDLETGWGSPQAVFLFADLTKTFVDLSLSVSSPVVGPGGSVTIQARLANRTTGAAIPGVPIEVSFSSTTSLGPCTGTYASAAPLTDVSGNISLSATVPWCYLGSATSVNVLVLANGYYGTNSTTVAVNLLGWFPALGGLSEPPNNVVGFLVIFVAASAIGYVLGRPRTRAAPPVVPPGVAPESDPPPPTASRGSAPPGGAVPMVPAAEGGRTDGAPFSESDGETTQKT